MQTRKRSAAQSGVVPPPRRPKRACISSDTPCLVCLEPLGRERAARAPCRHCRAPMHRACRAAWERHAPHPGVTCPVCKKDEGFWMTAQAAEVLTDNEKKHLVPVAQFSVTVHTYRLALVRARWDARGAWPRRADALVRRGAWVSRRLGGTGGPEVLDAHPRRVLVPWVPRGMLPRRQQKEDLTLLTRLPHLAAPLPPLAPPSEDSVVVLVCPLRAAACQRALARLVDGVRPEQCHASFGVGAPRRTSGVWWVLCVEAGAAARVMDGDEAWRCGPPAPLEDELLTAAYLGGRPCFSHAPRARPRPRPRPPALPVRVECRAHGPVKTEDDQEEDVTTIMATVYDHVMGQFTNEVLMPTLQGWGVIGLCRNSDTAAGPG